MNPERIIVQHLEEQLWQHIRSYRSDISRIISEGLEPSDEYLIKIVLSYTLSRMDITDYDLETE